MLAYFGQIELKSLEIRQYSGGSFVQFAAKSDGAILALDLISVSLIFLLWKTKFLTGNTRTQQIRGAGERLQAVPVVHLTNPPLHLRVCEYSQYRGQAPTGSSGGTSDKSATPSPHLRILTIPWASAHSK